MRAPKVYVLHENAEWTAPLVRELNRLDVPHDLWFLNEGVLDLSEPPPPGVFYNRMSASSHTREHRFAAEHTGCVLRWLETHGREILNGSDALALEISKVAQYQALTSAGIRTPRTVAAVGRAAIAKAASRFTGPFITKHNRGGKGLGVRKFDDLAALESYVASPHYESPIDGVTLVQTYIDSPHQCIIRCEFVGGKFLYAVQVDTKGSFELCPADACVPGDAICAVASTQAPEFTIVEHFASPLVAQYEAFLRANRVDIAGIEFIVDADGTAFTYDINTNTNYNAQAESRVQCHGMQTIARHLANRLLAQLPPRAMLRTGSEP